MPWDMHGHVVIDMGHDHAMGHGHVVVATGYV